MGPPYRPARQEVVPSLHEFTCRWAVGNNLSIDSTRLPKYVRPVGDSLQIGDETLAYSVKMREAGKKFPTNALYFVAEVGDSLYYHEVDTHYHDPDYDKSWQIRALRPLDVPEARSQYVWFEYNNIAEGTKDGKRYVSENWRGQVHTYDRQRGFRYLQWAPIRYEERIGGHLHGVRQLDVRIPEAGIMSIEERLQRGARVTQGRGWRHRLGRQVIDTEAIEREHEKKQ